MRSVLFFFFHDKAAGLRPEVGADDAFVVKHVGQAIDCDSDFVQVGKDVFFRIARARRIRLHEQKEDGFHRPALGIYFYVQPRVGAPLEGDRFLKVHVVINELLATGVRAFRISTSILLQIISYSSWMFVSLYFSFVVSEPLTACEAGASVTSNTRSLYCAWG